MPDGLPDIQDVGTGDWMRLVIQAFPGGGKTSLIATGAEGGYTTLIIRSSADLIPARALKSGAKQYIADRWEKMNEILDYCRMMEPFPYDWVWWDNGSIAQDVLLDDVWEATVASKPSRAYLIDKETGLPGKPNLDPTSGLDKGEYGRNMERISQWLRHMIGCNRFHFGVMTHPHEGQHPTNDEGGSLLRPYLQGKMMSEKLCGYANMVGFMEVMEGDEDKKWRRLHVAESSRFYAKDQYDSLLPKGYMDEPTIPKLMAAVEKARGVPLGNNVRPITSSRGGRRGTATPVAAPARRGRREQ